MRLRDLPVDPWERTVSRQGSEEEHKKVSAPFRSGCPENKGPNKPVFPVVLRQEFFPTKPNATTIRKFAKRQRNNHQTLSDNTLTSLLPPRQLGTITSLFGEFFCDRVWEISRDRGRGRSRKIWKSFLKCTRSQAEWRFRTRQRAEAHYQEVSFPYRCFK